MIDETEDARRPEVVSYAEAKLVTAFNDLSSFISSQFDGDWNYLGLDDRKDWIRDRLQSLIDEANRAVAAVNDG